MKNPKANETGTPDSSALKPLNPHPTAADAAEKRMPVSHSHPPNSQHGFAVIISLALMSFIVLLLISVTTFVRVESQAASTSLYQLEARQNAMLGAMVAVGELQHATGPDQRVTASAAIYDQSPQSDEVSGVNQAHWIGVWDSGPGLDWLNNRYDSSNPYYNFSARRDGSDGRFISWLVSGNQNDRSSIAFARDFDSSEAVELVGLNFDNTDPLQARNRVSVEKVNIQAARGRMGGRYAFWVGDDSAKAHLTAFDEDNAAGLSEDIVRRIRFMVNQRNGVELMQPVAENPFADFAGFDASLDRLLSLDEALLTATARANGLSEEAQRAFLNRHFHSLSLYSSGLLTNTLSGGLRADLSAFLRNADRNNLVPFSGLTAYRDGAVHRLAPSFSGTANHPAAEGPTWEQMVDYFQNRADDGSAMDIRKHTERQSGMHPVITRMRLDVIPLFEKRAGGDEFFLCLAPAVVLNNPYDRPLNIPAGSVWVHFLLEERDEAAETGVFLMSEWTKSRDQGGTRQQVIEHFSPNGPALRPGTTTTTYQPWVDPQTPNLLENDLLRRFEDSNGTGYRGFSFLLPSVTLQPGAVLTFEIANHLDSYNGNNVLKVGAVPEGDQNVVRLPTRDLAGNELRASPLWSEVNSEQPEQGGLHLQGDGLPRAGDANPGARLNPFLLTIGLADRDVGDLTSNDFIFRAERVLCSNPNVNMRFVSGGVNQSRNGRPFVGPTGQGLWDLDRMANVRSIRLDLALGGAFNYAANDRTTSALESNGVRYGYLINQRWSSNASWRNPVQRMSSVDERADPNASYGAIASYSPWEGTGGINMHKPVVETSGDSAFWGTGVDSNAGENEVALLGSPRVLPGLFSLAQLRHFIVSPDGVAAESIFASGIAPRRLGNSGQVINRTASGNAISGSPSPVDWGYVINDRLWDGFFFSGLSTAVNNADLANWEFIPLNQKLRPSDDATENLLNDPRFAAAGIKVKGGFNINSTDVAAWKALLGSGNQLAFNPVSGDSADALDSPFSRTGFPQAGSGSSTSERISGFRELADSELQALAEAIVSEVKRRGPFLSIADFVNRRLQPGNAREALFATIEAAIREAGINATLASEGGNFTAANYPSSYEAPDGLISGLSLGSLREGLSQWLTQADVLEQLAPLLTARGDTFTIRAYGESLEIGGDIGSTARCELVVQRLYEYVDDSDDPAGASWQFDQNAEGFVDGGLSQTNRQFGRQYKILGFRWL